MSLADLARDDHESDDFKEPSEPERKVKVEDFGSGQNIARKRLTKLAVKKEHQSKEPNKVAAIKSERDFESPGSEETSTIFGINNSTLTLPDLADACSVLSDLSNSRFKPSGLFPTESRQKRKAKLS
jgi:hypothetical protein